MKRAAAPWLLGAAFALLYGATWSGRYFHDGTWFVNWFESGRLGHYHLLYLPAAEAIRLLLLGSVSAETALGILSVLSGAGAVAFSAALALRATGNLPAALAAAAAVGISPAAWFGAGVCEVHIFAAFGASLAAFLAYASPLGLRRSLPLAAAAASLTHLSGAFLAPSLLALAIAGERARGRSIRPVPTIAAAAGIVVVGLGVGLVLAKVVGLRWARTPGLALAWLSNLVGSLPLEPAHLFRRLEADFFVPWGLVSASFAVAPFLRPRGSGPLVAGSLLALGFLGVLICAAFPLDGQYAQVLFPFFALCTALPLARLTVEWRALGVLAVLVPQVAYAIPTRARLAAEPHRAWAEAVASAIDRPAWLLCDGPARTRLAKTVAKAEAWEFFTPIEVAPPVRAGEIARDIERARAEGKQVYLDETLLDPGYEIPLTRDVCRELQALLVLAPPGGPVRKVLGTNLAPR